MKKLMLALSVMFVAGASRATLPAWMQESDAANLVAKAKKKAAQMKAADAALVAAPQGLIQISAGESGHLLELARRVVERGDVTLTGKVDGSDKYDAYACEDMGTYQIAAVAKPETCARVFTSTAGARIVAMEVLADLHVDGSRSIKGVKIFSGYTYGPSKTAVFPENGLWINEGRMAQYTTARQVTSEGQSEIKENLDVWGRMTLGMMGLDDSCYYANGGTCG